jgi:hypothetical protein
MDHMRKLDTSTANPDLGVQAARVAFDTHLNDCRQCQPHMCPGAESLWRTVCVTALHARSGGRSRFTSPDGTPWTPVSHDSFVSQQDGHPKAGA